MIQFLKTPKILSKKFKSLAVKTREKSVCKNLPKFGQWRDSSCAVPKRRDTPLLCFIQSNSFRKRKKLQSPELNIFLSKFFLTKKNSAQRVGDLPPIPKYGRKLKKASHVAWSNACFLQGNIVPKLAVDALNVPEGLLLVHRSILNKTKISDEFKPRGSLLNVRKFFQLGLCDW